MISGALVKIATVVGKRKSARINSFGNKYRPKLLLASQTIRKAAIGARYWAIFFGKNRNSNNSATGDMLNMTLHVFGIYYTILLI